MNPTRFRRGLGLLLAFLLTRTVALALPGDLDLTFGSGTGKVTTPLGSGDALANATAIQSDGKIVVVGTASNGSDNDFCVIRYNSDGSLDSSFHSTGSVLTPVGSGDDVAKAVVLQTDGKIVVAGSATVGSFTDFAVVRYNSDGSLDSTFLSTGIVTLSMSGGDDYAQGVVVQSDGKILVAGFSSNGSNTDFALARLNDDGTPDSAFNTTGQVVTPVGGFSSGAYSVALQGDGKIVAAGYAFDGSSYDFAVLRYDASGTLDSTFNSTGIVTTPLGMSDDFAFKVVVQADGKIVAAGYGTVGGGADFALARYQTNGALDPGFNGTGKVLTAIGPGDDIGNSLAIQSSDQKLVVTGYASNGTDSDFAIVRYKTDGTLDTTFQGTGKVTTPVGAADDLGASVAIQSDGRYVIAGYTLNGATYEAALVRYQGDTPPVVTTDAATGIQPTQATFNGTVNPKGVATTAYVEISTDSGMAGATPVDAAVDVGSGNSPVPFSQPGNLLPHTTYYYRAVASSLGGAGQGNILSFTTPDSPPAVTTLAADGISPVAATLHGTGNPLGLMATGYFEYGTDPLLADASVTPDLSLGAGQTPVAMDQPIGPLAPGATYYYRAVVATAAGTSAGAILSFSTGASVPVGTILQGPVVNPVNGHAYYLLSADTWTSSEARARTLGGHLVTINDAAENQWVYDTFDGANQHLWIGLTDLVKEGTFGWVNGQAVTYTNWNGGEPNDGAGGPPEDFAHLISGNGGLWNDGMETALLVGVVEVPDAELVVDVSSGVPGQPNSTFFEFGAPAVDGGRVGGAATITTNGKKQTIIFGGIDGGVIANTSGPAPGDAVFTALGDPVFAGEGLAFTAVSRANPAQIPLFLIDTRLGIADSLRATTPRLGKPLAGLFSKTSRSNSLRLAARQGDGAPGASDARFSKLPTFGLPRNRPGVFFTGKLARGGGVTAKNDSGVWREKTAGNDSDLLLRTGFTILAAEGETASVTKLTTMIPVESATDQRRSFAPDGTVSALAAFADKTTGLVIVDSAGTKLVPVTSRSVVPGLPDASFDRLDPPAVAHGGLFAFHAALRAAARGLPPPPNSAIFVSRNGLRTRVAAVNDVLGSQTQERLRSVGQPLLGQSGLLAFLTTLQRVAGNPVKPVRGIPVRKGIVQVRDDDKKVIIAVGDPAPECGAGVTLQRIQSVVVTDTPGGHIVFTGTVTGKGLDKLSRQGIWSVSSSGVIKLLLRTNQTVVVNPTGVQPTLRVFEALQAKPASQGQGRSTDEVGFVTAKVKLSDRRTGVLRIPLK